MGTYGSLLSSGGSGYCSLLLWLNLILLLSESNGSKDGVALARSRSALAGLRLRLLLFFDLLLFFLLLLLGLSFILLLFFFSLGLLFFLGLDRLLWSSDSSNNGLAQ